MSGRFPAKLTILITLKPLGRFFLVLSRRVVPAFAIGTRKMNEFSHKRSKPNGNPMSSAQNKNKIPIHLLMEIIGLVGFPHLFEGMLRFTTVTFACHSRNL